jgi:hypothetical protein
MAKHTRLQVTSGMSVPTISAPRELSPSPSPSQLPSRIRMSEGFGGMSNFKISRRVKMAIIVIVASFLIYKIMKKSKGKKSDDILDSITTSTSRIFM